MIKLILIALYIYVLIAMKLSAEFIDGCIAFYYCAITLCVMLCMIKPARNVPLAFLICCILFFAALFYFPVNRMIYKANEPFLVSGLLNKIVSFLMANNLFIVFCILSVLCFIVTIKIVFYIKNTASIAQDEQKNILDSLSLEDKQDTKEQIEQATIKEAFYSSVKSANEFIKYCSIIGIFFVLLVFLLASFVRSDDMAAYLIANSIIILIIPSFLFALLVLISLKSSLEKYY